MTTTTNFKKWAGFLLLTSIFLLSGTTNIKAADSPPPTEICITPGAKTFDFLLPSVPDCDRSNVSPSWTCNIKNGSVRINGKNVEIDGIDTSLTYIFTGCCNIEGIDYCSEISYHFNYGFDPYDGPSNYSVCIGEGGVNFSGILCEVPVFTLPSGFSRSGNRINFNASVGTGIYTIEICCGACCETFTISITNGPDAGPDQQLCGIPFSVELGAANPGDSWSFLNGPDYATVDVNSGSATLGAAYGIYCFELTTKGGECKDQVCITVCDPLNLPNIIACDGVATVSTSANI